MVDLLKEPLALNDLASPRLSWVVEDDAVGAVQQAYQVLVATHPDLLKAGSADVWDSGRVEADQSLAVPYDGPELEPRSRYYWTVRTWNADHPDPGPFADPSTIGTALKDTWTADPIWAPAPEDSFADWADYRVEAEVEIIDAAATLWFRATDADDNYMWQFREGSNELAKHVWVDGDYELDVVDLDTELAAGEMFDVMIEVEGPTITTSIDGELVDVTDDASHDAGGVGFRHGNAEAARYGNVRVTELPDGEPLFDTAQAGSEAFPCGELDDGVLSVGNSEQCLVSPDEDGHQGSGDVWALLRGDIEVDTGVEHATLYATATDPEPAAQYVFRAELNGELVGVGPTRGYDGDLPYNAYDVTDLINEGNNALSVVAYAAQGQAFLAELDIVYTDGRRDTLVTGPDWAAFNGDQLYEDIGNSGNSTYYVAPREYLRADRWPTELTDPDVDLADWERAVVQDDDAFSSLIGLPTQNLIREPRDPASIEWIDDDAVRLDFHRSVVGGLEIDVDAAGGEVLDVRLGEELNDDGSVRYDMRTDNHYRDQFTLAEGEQSVGHWGYRVFRYAEVHGLPDGFDPESIDGWSWLYPFDDDAAAFSSSDDVLDEIWDFSRDSLRTLNVDLYMDTPSRERRAYEADAFLQQLMHYALDRDYALARYSTEYLYENYTWPTEWKLTSPTAAWRDYLHTGDDRSLERWYDLLVDTKSVRHFMDDRGLVVKDPGGDHDPDAWTDIVDWPESQRDGYEFTDINTVVNSYNERSLRDLGRIAKTLGREAEAEDLTAAADESRAAIVDYLYDEDAGAFRDGLDVDHHALHASVYPLHFGIVEDEEVAAAAGEHIVDRGIRGNIFSAAFQVSALFDHGRADEAVQLLTSQETNSWWNMIQLGAGATMETWDPSLKSNTTYSHPAGASPTYLVPTGLFGIEPIEPGHRRFSVEPRPGGIEQAELRLPTISGAIEVAFDHDGDRSVHDLRVPANTVAELQLSAEEVWHVTVDGVPLDEAAGVEVLDVDDDELVLEVVAGNHRFVIDPAAPDPGTPIADAGGPYIVQVGETLELDGRGSSSPVDSQLDHRWDLGELGGTVDGATVTMVVDEPVATAVELTVTDAEGRSDRDATVVTVIERDDPPPDEAVCPPNVRPSFSDAIGTFHEAAIACLEQAGITLGDGDGRFRPADTVTREQLASFLDRLLRVTGVDLPDNPPDAFTDDDGSHHEAAINRMYAAGVVRGTTDGTYQPREHATRAQATSMVVRAVELAAGESLPRTSTSFTDLEPPHTEAIEAAYAAQLTFGRTATEFDPRSGLRRDQMAALLARALRHLETGER